MTSITQALTVHTDAVEGLIHASYMDGYTSAMNGVTERMSKLHFASEDGTCAEDGYEMPCSTIKTALGIDVGTDIVKEQPNDGIKIETKEGNISHEMKPAEVEFDKTDKENQEADGRS